jgi:ParB family transcriptional regulator, chromosome partitioning protein
MAIKHGLGRGLGALIQDRAPAEQPAEAPAGIRQVPIERIRANPWQPRRAFDVEALADLARSIRERGVLQPLLVRTAGEEFELIAGERRLRAAADAGLRTVPVILTEAADRDSLELALVENLQREDLNVLEEAAGYQALATNFGLTQDQIADRVGKARASVANAVRILTLPDPVKKLLAENSLSAGHAKALIGLEIPDEQVLFASRVIRENLSVRQLETLIQKARRAPRKPRVSRADLPPSHLAHLSDKLHAHFGTSIRITPCRTLANGKKVRGSIEVDYYSNDDLHRILQLLGLADE